MVENPTAADYTVAAQWALDGRDLALARTQIAAALTFDPLDEARLALADRILVASGDTSRAAGSSFFGDIALRARALARVGRFREALPLLVEATAFRDTVPYLEWTRSYPASALATGEGQDEAIWGALGRWFVRLPPGAAHAEGTSKNLAVVAEWLARWATPAEAARAPQRSKKPTDAASARRHRQDAAVLFALLQRRLDKILDERTLALLESSFEEAPSAIVAGELGRQFLAGARFDEAARWFAEAAKLEPDAVEYLLDQANAELREGDWEAARATYARALKLGPDPEPSAAIDLAYLDAMLGDESDRARAEERLIGFLQNRALDDTRRRRAGLLRADVRAFSKELPLPDDPLTQIAFDRLRATAMGRPSAMAAGGDPGPDDRAIEVRVASETPAPLALRLAFALGLQAFGASGSLIVLVEEQRPDDHSSSGLLMADDPRAVPRSALGTPPADAAAWLAALVAHGDEIPLLLGAVEQAAPGAPLLRGVLAAALAPPAPPPSRHPLRWVRTHLFVGALVLVNAAGRGDDEAARLWGELVGDPDPWLHTAAFVALETGRKAGWSVATLDKYLVEGSPAERAAFVHIRDRLALATSDGDPAGRRALRRRHLDRVFGDRAE